MVDSNVNFMKNLIQYIKETDILDIIVNEVYRVNCI